jgi:hypothetical protein
MPVRTGRGRLKPASFVNEDGSMRSHHIIAIAIVLVVGFGVARFFLSSPTAEANVDTLERFSMDISKMHANTNLPDEKIHDMTFVFSHGD